MSRVKIRIIHKNDASGQTRTVRTVWIDRDSDKKLAGKKAGQILAGNFPEFDNFSIRSGLTRTENGWRASRTIKPTEKCSYHYIWEQAFITEEEAD